MHSDMHSDMHSERGGMIVDAMIGFALLAITLLGLSVMVASVARMDTRANAQIAADQALQREVLSGSASGGTAVTLSVAGKAVSQVQVYSKAGVWYASPVL